MGRVREAFFGYKGDETAEQRVRRLNTGRWNGYIQPVLPSLVELYDRIAVLEARIDELSRRP